MDYKETASKYIDSLKIRARKLKEENKQEQADQLEQVIKELATIFNLPNYL